MSKFIRSMEPLRPPIDWNRLLELRLERATRLMERDGIDAVLVQSFEPVLYFSNWPRWSFLFTHRYCALYPRGRPEPVLFCPFADEGAVEHYQLFEDIRGLPTVKREWPKEFARAFSDYGLVGKRVGLDPNMHGSLYENIKQQINEVEFVNVGNFLSEVRAVKNEEEVKAYDFTLSIIEGGINTAINTARESWGRHTEVEICAVGIGELLKRGCTRCNIWIASGENAAPLNRFPTDRPVRGEEICLVDGGGSFNGYRAEFARSIWTGGRPSAEHKKIYQTVYRCHERIREIMRPGIKGSEIDRMVMDTVEEAGYTEFYGGHPYTGHGIGITQEPPWITCTDPNIDSVLETGMILNIEPGIWKPGVGGFRIEDTYLITETGWQRLSRAPYEEDLLC